MNITFVYFYTLVCSKCGAKIMDIAPTSNGTPNQHSFSTNCSVSCPNCGENDNFNVISAQTKVFKE